MFKQSLQLKLGQSLTMTPQLQQAIRLLQMPTAELQAHIAELLDTNVMLEQEEPEEEELAVPFAELDPRTTQAEEPSTPEVEIIDEPWADRVGTSSDGAGAGSGGDDDERQNEVADLRGENLRDHLLAQLELAGLSTDDLATATTIVDALNDDGYLTETQIGRAHV